MADKTIDTIVDNKKLIRFAHNHYHSKEIEAAQYCSEQGITGEDILPVSRRKTLLEYFGPERYYPKTT